MNGREISLAILSDIYYKKGYSNITINKYIRKYGDRESRFIRELVYGSLENLIYLDCILSKVSKVKKGRIQKDIYLLLIMSIYQIYFMEKVPDRAVVNEAVEISKKISNRGGSSFVNGVLRNIIRNKDKLAQIPNKDQVEYLSIKYSHPSWLVSVWVDRFGLDFTKELLKSNNEVAEFYIRVNTSIINRDKLATLLIDKGYIIKKSNINDKFIKVENPTGILNIEEFKKGYFSVQDISSGYVAKLMEPKEDDLVLDLCAAPGGKTLDIAERMMNKGKILARDLHPHRLQLIEGNMNRLNINNIELKVQNAREIDESLLNKIDKCLVDAPCSGLGTIRRNPEIKLNIKKESIYELSIIQKDILDKAKEYIKPGGYLFYSTCTIMQEENEDVIEDFLSKNKNFNLIKIYDRDYLNLYPNKDDSDGFFIAKLKRME